MDKYGKYELEIYNSIKDLLLNLEPIVRASSIDAKNLDLAAQHVVSHLREHSDACGSFSLNRTFIHLINAELDDAIKTEVKFLASINASALPFEEFHKLKAESVDKIARFNGFVKLQHFVRTCIDRSTKALVGRFDVELDPVNMLSGRNKSGWFGNRHSMSDDADSMDSCLTLLDGGLLNPEQFHELVEGLNPTNHIDVRIRSLGVLCGVSSADLLSGYQFSELLPCLADALVSSNATLSQLSFQFHAKMLASTSSFAVKEMYVNLVAVVKRQFLAKKQSSVIHVDSNVDLTKTVHRMQLLIFRLIHRCQLGVVEHWIRYPEAHVKAILENSIDLLTFTPKDKTILAPFQHLALLDAEAWWFRRWMRTMFSRILLVDSLRRHKDWLENLVHECFQYMQSYVSKASNRSSKLRKEHWSRRYDSEVVAYVTCHSALCIVGTLLRYFEGRRLFNYVLLEQRSRAQEIILTFGTLLCSTCKCSGMKCNKFCLGHCISAKLVELVKDESSCDTLMLNSKLLDTLCSMLQKLLEQEVVGRLRFHLLVDVLVAYAENPLAKESLTYHRISDVLWAVGLRCVNEPTFPNRHLNLKLIRTCSRLCNHVRYDTIHLADTFAFLQSLYALWQSTDDNSSDAECMGNDQSKNENKDLLNDLVLFASTSLGVNKLQSLKALEDCIFGLTAKCADIATKIHILPLAYMASTEDGILAMESSGCLQHLVNELWILQEANNSDVAMMTFFPDDLENVARKLIDKILTFTSSFDVVATVLNIACSGPNLLASPPRSLQEFLGLVLFQACNIKDFPNPDLVNLFALYLLSGWISNLSTSLFLQAQYGYQDILLQQQMETQSSENGSVILDQLSVQRNYILVKTLDIGGPNERMLPLQTWQINGNEEMPELFTTTAVPSIYRLQRVIKFSVDNEALECLLADDDLTLQQWKDKCCNALASVLITNQRPVQDKLLFKLLEKWISFSKPEVVNSPMFKKTPPPLSKEYQLGMKLTIRYGVHLAFFNDHDKIEGKLHETLSAYQGNLAKDNCNPAEFPWHIASLFLMARGGRNGSLTSPLFQLHDLSFSLGPELVSTSDFEQEATFMHVFEFILSIEMPSLHSAFWTSSLPPSRVVCTWIKQCYWNYLDWNEICQYMFLSLVNGPKLAICYCLAVLHHLKRQILHETHRGTLTSFLMQTPLHQFQLHEHIDYITELARKYSDLMNNFRSS